MPPQQNAKITSNAEEDLNRFNEMMRRDAQLIEQNPWLARWLFADLLEKRNERKGMSFKGFEGVEHLRKFFGWNQQVKHKDYFPEALIAPLIETSANRDMACAESMGLSVPADLLKIVGRYNAQDYLFQRMYPVPERQKIRRILDFGAGLGRMANLAFGAPGSVTEFMITVDGIPSTYLTQRLYFRGLGLKHADYLDYSEAKKPFDIAQLEKSCQLAHLPTWRMDLIASESMDLVCCVQVLRELPQKLFVYAVKQFARILKPGGALYVRDHLQFHNPNQMPQDDVLEANGFTIEFRPQVRDRDEVHGLPRIWRKFDESNYIQEEAPA